MTAATKYAIVADDEPANLDFMVRLIQMAGFEVTGAGMCKQAISSAQSAGALTLALIDHQLPDGRGIDVITAIRPLHPEAILVMATMHDHRELIDEAFGAGVDIFLVKPHGFMELFRRVQEIAATGGSYDSLRRMIMDQYGPRPYRGTPKKH